MITQLVRDALVILLLGAPFFLAERFFAARPVSYRKVLVRDLGAFAIVVLFGFATGVFVKALFFFVPVLSTLRRTGELPLLITLPLVVLLTDFAMYWAHRLIHTRALWRIHRWHHAPRHMYWLAGARTSLVQGILYSIAPVLIVVVLNVSPAIVGGNTLFSVVVNHWMHANLGFRSRVLEAVFVTPRIHHVHHSSDPRHFGRNFGSLFSFWDRMFGTFLDPDDVHGPLEFGIPEVVSGPRMVLGV